MIYKNGKLFDTEELTRLRGCFDYVERDCTGKHRLFFDNAGGSLRLKAASEEFDRINRIPDASEHNNEIALYLADLEEKTKADVMHTVFGAKHGALYPSYTASQITTETVRIISEHARGTNYVTTVLEHPSAYDAVEKYASEHSCELRVARANAETGGVDAEAVVSLIDENTALLCCMAASNISGCIYPLEEICKRAREINPDIYIIIDAVQHAPHGVLDPEKIGADVTVFAPYKFFGVRGMGLAYLSDRVASLPHAKLAGKSETDWEIGSPATPHFAAVGKIIDYVVGIGESDMPGETDRRALFVNGMKRIADHERALLHLMLEGTDKVTGLRHISGVHVRMDGEDLLARDFIIGIDFDGTDAAQAAKLLEERGVVTYERSPSSIYSKRMLDAFGIYGVVRISPLHVNTPEEIEEFLGIVKDVAKEIANG